MLTRLPLVSALSICSLAFAAFTIECVFALHKHAQLQQRISVYEKVQYQQLKELDRAVAKVKEIRKQATKPKTP
jgi:hypothetical protein